MFGLAAALTWVLFAGRRFPGWTATAWAASAGVCGCLGIGALYRGMAVGAMGIVAPVSAVSAVIPFAIGIASGERPGELQVVGIVLALAGVAVASREPADRGGGVLIMMITISPLLALVALVTIPMSIFTMKAITKRSKTHVRRPVATHRRR